MNYFSNIFSKKKPQPNQQQDIFQNFSEPIRKARSPEQPVDYMISMKAILKSILDILSQKGENVSEFKDKLKNSKFVQGKNFQGQLNDQGQIKGLGLFYRKNDQVEQILQYCVYFGEIANKKRIGRGIEVIAQIAIQSLKKGNTQSFFFIDSCKLVKAFLLEKWDEQQQQGFYYDRKIQGETTFKGTFKDHRFHKGILRVYAEDRLKYQYSGSFQKSKFQGMGQLLVAGKSKYKGQFNDNVRDGFGEQQDFINKTIYIGEFETNKRHGYGQLIFKNRNQIRLKGFWNENFLKHREGVFVNAKGEPIEIFQDDNS